MMIIGDPTSTLKQQLFATDLSDLIRGGAGNDFLYGGEGADTVDGGTGNDRLFGDEGTSFLGIDIGDDGSIDFGVNLLGGFSGSFLASSAGTEWTITASPLVVEVV